MVLLTAALLMAQRGGRGGGGGNTTGQAPSDLIVRGSVALPDGVVPERIVRVERLCGGRTEDVTYADSKGRFSFDLGVLDRPGNVVPANTRVITESALKICSIRAGLSGYRTQSIPLEQAAKNQNLGEIKLEPIGKQPNVLMSATDGDVPKNAKKDYDKGLDALAKSKVPDAISSMEKATAGYPKFATAWLSLGMLQVGQNDAAGALHSFEQAMAADDKFAAPYLEAASLEAAAAQWPKVIEHTNKVISLDPDSFAGAYYLNAMANIRLNQGDAARKSAAEGLRVDEDHAYPDLEYINGILLMSKNDREGARKRFQNYLDLAPNGTNAANAKQLLSELPTAK